MTRLELKNVLILVLMDNHNTLLGYVAGIIMFRLNPCSNG